MEKETKIRKAAVAGMFYPIQPQQIKDQIHELLQSETKNIKLELATPKIIGGIVPHAGYIYSGYEAVHFFELIRKSGKEFDTIVILNPDHQGYSPEFATSPHDYWETPLGRIALDREMAKDFQQSEWAHSKEHSAEVMLPFIQILFDTNLMILPISIGSPTPDTAKKLALKIQKSAIENNKKILIIASSDFSHYVTPQEGERLDNVALESITSLDSSGLFDKVRRYGLTVCGYGPIMTLIEYSLLIAQKPKVNIAARGNSGKNSPSNSVVDYITIIFSA